MELHPLSCRAELKVKVSRDFCSLLALCTEPQKGAINLPIGAGKAVPGFDFGCVV